MIALPQRVAQASVSVEGVEIAAIRGGLLALICAEKGDSAREAEAMAERIARYRMFGDEQGRMNRSLMQLQESVGAGAGLILVPQFTLAADTRSGLRPSFTPAAAPAEGRTLFDELVAAAACCVRDVQTGRFGGDMQVALVNDGPVTFWLQIPPGSLR